MMTGSQGAVGKLRPDLLGGEGTGKTGALKAQFHKAQLVPRALNERTKLFCFFSWQIMPFLSLIA